MSLKYSVALLCTIISAAYAQQSPYFPRNGTNAASQIVRQIKNPSSYLVVAIAPGFEDRASIANFRIGTGATVAVVYVTNGEDIPSDLNGEMFYQIASRRKEEAYQSLSYLGAQSFFLNIPVSEFSNGTACFHPATTLAETLNDRLDSVLTLVKPDVIVLERDPFSGNKESARLTYLRRLIVKNLYDKNKTPLWKMKRLFIEAPESHHAAVVPVGQRDPVWSESYVSMAHTAEKFYASLRYQIPLWNEASTHRYAQVFPEKMKATIPLDNGVPQIGAPLKAVEAAVRPMTMLDKSLDRQQRLVMLRNVIAQVDAFIQSHAQTLSPTDLRVLACWKLQLENLRCQILDVKIQYTVSDTVLTPVQVFFLRFGALDALSEMNKTQILFPGVIQKQWIVNEQQESFYTLKDSAQFRVLSPRPISLNSTETPQGFGALQVRTPLIFIVSHQDSNPNYNFMYREEIPLIIAPYRSAEVLSPLVMMYRDTNIYVRFRSNVRDKTKGVLYVNDPVVSSPEKKIEFPGKNFVETDTLLLVWKDTVMTAPHEVTIWAGPKNPVGKFIAYPLDVKVRDKVRVIICSAIENSPVQIALHRLGVPTTPLEAVDFSSKEMSDNPVLVVDQFSFTKFMGLGKQWDSVEQWLRRGGRLIILPQHGTESVNPILGNEIAFTGLSVGDCREKLSIDSTDDVFHRPNALDEQSFTGERFAISYGGLTEKNGSGSKVLMRVGDRLLLLEKSLDKGRIFYCSINLFPKLLDFDKPAYELLANLLGAGFGQ